MKFLGYFSFRFRLEGEREGVKREGREIVKRERERDCKNPIEM